MRKRFYLTLACAGLTLQSNISPAENIPIPENPMLAQTALGFNPKNRCPDLRLADEGTIAVVVFLVGRSGIPSKVSIKSTSGSAGLDAAAVSCVMKLRFAPATRLGDGEPFDAWQQIAWRWADRGNQNDGRPPSPPGQTSTISVGSATQAGAGEVTVHVCVDDEGKLKQNPVVLHSSGDTRLDEAAVKIAASGPQYYHPGTTVDGRAVSGCAQLAIKFETKQ